MVGAPAPSPTPCTSSGVPPDVETRQSLHRPPRFEANTISLPSAVQARPSEALLMELTSAVCLTDFAFGPTQRRDEVIGGSVTRGSITYEGDVTAVWGPRRAVFLSGTAGQSERGSRANQLDVNIGIVV